MDKINRALLAADENADAIRELKRIAYKPRCEVVVGTVKNGNTYFGKVNSSGGAVIVKYSGATSTLNVGEKTVSDSSPILASLPVGEVEIFLSGAHAGATLVAIGTL